MRTIRIDECNVRYKISGSGEKIVAILQGWGTKLEDYDCVAQTLAKNYRVLQFDFPGFGLSSEPKEAWSVDDYADLFCKLLIELKINEVTLLGHSYGGRVAIKLATRKSLNFNVRDLVLIDSAGIKPVKTRKQMFKERQYRAMKKVMQISVVEKVFYRQIESWRSRQGSADYRNASPIMKQCLVKAVNEDLRKLLPKITQETLLIWGENDTATPLFDGKLMNELIPNSGFVVLKGAGHFSFLDSPIVFRKVLESYFKIGDSDGC